MELQVGLEFWGKNGGAVHARLGLACRQPHIDHGCDQIGVVRSTDVVLHGPLVDNQHTHPAEHGVDEDDLRDELEYEVSPGLHLDVVAPLQDDSEHHLQHAQDDGQLHLETVLERDFLGGAQPHRVESERIDTFGVRSLISVSIFFEGIARSEQIQGQPSEIIVNLPHEHSPEAHLQEEPLETPDLEPFVRHEHHHRNNKHKCPVEYIPKHDSELEWECDAVEQRGVEFLLARHALGVGDHLRERGPLVLPELGGRVQFQFGRFVPAHGQYFHLTRHEFVRAHVGLDFELDHVIQLLQLDLWHPCFRDED